MSPTVSIVIPAYNEAATIEGLLEAIYQQTASKERMEVLVVDGMSEDGTRSRIRAFAQAHPDLRLEIVDNPDRTIPHALNRGIERATGQVVIRLDAHSEPAADYVERSLETLERTGAANVGGVWRIEPGADRWAARSIAVAAGLRLGAGDARYRISGDEGPVDTVPFGAFRREWLQRIGPFNQLLLTNEDYEYNARIRQAGGQVWFNPQIRSRYLARPGYRPLARQYARYGYWKARMIRTLPRTLRWRQALPPLFVLATAILAVGGLWWPGARWLLGLGWLVYVSALLASGLGAAWRHRRPAHAWGVPLALVVMHLGWGAAFLAGLVDPRPLEQVAR